jgi:hypothetical protein
MCSRIKPKTLKEADRMERKSRSKENRKGDVALEVT